MTRGCKTAAVLGLFQFLSLIAESKDQQSEPDKLSPAVQQMFGWLPPDTETIIVSQRPFELPGKNGLGNEKSWDELPMFPVGPILGLHDGLLREKLQGQEILIAIEGSRHLQVPEGWGMGHYEGCHILRFNEASDELLQSVFQACLDQADNKTQLRGKDVAVFSKKIEGYDWSFFVTRPQRGILLCATDRKYLEEVLQRMEGKQDGRALPEHLPEWKHVNVKAQVWAIHHYREKGRELDDEFIPDSEAVGFVFSYDSDVKKVVTARYLSRERDPARIVEGFWSKRTEPAVAQVEPGVVEFSVPAGLEGWLFLLCFLGHMVVIL